MQTQIIDALRRGAHDEALALAREAVAARPDDPQAHRGLAMALRAGGDNDAALASIDHAIALAPDDADLHFHRAGYLLGERQLEAAQAALSQTVELDPNQFGAYVMQAQLALSRNDADEAQRLATLAARVAPGHPWTRMLEGSIALQRGDADRALAVLSQAAQQAPEDGQIRYALGFAHLRKGHLAFAEQAFRGVLEKNPDSHGLRGLLAELLRRQGRPAEAATELAPLLERADATPALRRFAGELEMLAGRNDRALPLLRDAFAAQPRDGRALGVLFEALRRAGDRDDARNTFDAALATTPDWPPLWRARLAVENAADDAALAVVERWLAAMPDAVAPLESQMVLLGARGDAEGAEAIARRIVERQPGHALAELRLVDRMLQRDPAQAIEYIDTLLEKATEDGARRELRGWLALAQDRAGRHADAVATWSALHAEAAPQALPLPEPTAPREAWPPLASVAPGAPAVAFLVGAPGSGVERVARILGGTMPAFRADRFGPAAGLPKDLLQNFHTMRRLAEGELDAATVARSWREQLPARGLQGGQAVDWLLWWDNALLPVLRAHLPQASVLIAVRDPRDMLLDWLAFGTPIPFRLESPTIAAAWLARHLEQVAVLHEQSLFAHTLLRMDRIHHDGAAVAAELGKALRANIVPPPAGLFGAPHFAAGRWRDHAIPLADAFAALTPVARRLGYPET